VAGHVLCEAAGRGLHGCGSPSGTDLREIHKQFTRIERFP
jgi:hypothetical protein